MLEESQASESAVAQVAGFNITAKQALSFMSSVASAAAAGGEGRDEGVEGEMEQGSLLAHQSTSANQGSNPEQAQVAGVVKQGMRHTLRTLGAVRKALALEYRPWTSFFDPSRFRKPTVSGPKVLGDVLWNLRYWLYNYCVLALVVFVYSLLTNPILILCFLLSGGCWVWLTMVRKEPVVVMGRTLNQTQLLYALGSFSIIAFVVTSGYRTLVWSLVFSSFFSVVHAVFREPVSAPKATVSVEMQVKGTAGGHSAADDKDDEEAALIGAGQHPVDDNCV